MASGIYNCFKTDILSGDVNLASGGDTITVALYTDSASFDATDTVYATTNEVAEANGYERGDMKLSTQSLSGTTTVAWKGDPTEWTATGAGFTARFAKISSDTNTRSLICCFDFGSNQTASGGGTFTITWDGTDGILNLA
jgi:hypothetical protein